MKQDDAHIRNQVRDAINDCTRGIENAPSLRHRVLEQAKGDAPMKKKFTAAMALALALLLLTTSALAATALKNGVLNWLFRGEEAPEEMLSMVQQNGNVHKTEHAALTLRETLFDGKELSVHFTLQNPTEKPLVYTVHHARLNDVPLISGTAQLPYGNYTGQALGGQVDGCALPMEDTFFVSFMATSDATEEWEGDDPETYKFHSIHKYPLQPLENATLSVRVDVFEPLAEYTAVSQTEYASGEYDIVSDKLPILADEGLVDMASLPSPSRLKKIESLEFSFPITMKETKITTLSAAPGAYTNDQYTLHLDHFTLTPTGGLLEGHITDLTPAPAFVSSESFLSVFPEDVFEQALETKDHALSLHLASYSSGMSTSPDLQPTDFHFSVDFRSNAGELPRGVYLVWLDNTQTYWDSAIYIPLLSQ